MSEIGGMKTTIPIDIQYMKEPNSGDPIYILES